MNNEKPSYPYNLPYFATSDSAFLIIPLEMLNDEGFIKISIVCYTYFKRLSNLHFIGSPKNIHCYHLSYQDYLSFYDGSVSISKRRVTEQMFRDFYKQWCDLDITKDQSVYTISFSSFNLRKGDETYSTLYLNEFIKIIQLNKRYDMINTIFKVYLYLKFFISKGAGHCYYALSYYEKATGVNRKTIKEILQLLRSLKLIYYEKTNFRVLYPGTKFPKQLYVIVEYQKDGNNHEHVKEIMRTIKSDPYLKVCE